MTKVAMETVDPVRRRLAVEIPAGQVTAEMDRAYDQLRRRANVPGFRQGRAPRPVLERLYGGQVEADVYGRLVQETYAEALRDQKLDPVGHPEIVTEHAARGQPLRYSATIEVRPEVVATGYTSLAVERPLRPVTDEDVERFLDSLRERHMRLEPIAERDTAEQGDIAAADYEARAQGRVVGRAQSRLIEVGGAASDGPGAHLVGARLGVPTIFDVDYPADHPSTELAGQRVTFRVTMTALHTRVVPPLDDAFAKEQADCEDVASLRARVREQLEASVRREGDASARSALMTRLVSAHAFDVPQAMIDRRLEMLVEDVLDNLGNRRPPASREAEFRARLRSELRDQARDQVKAALLLEAIATQEHLSVEEADLDERIDQLAEAAGKARERVRALYQEPGSRGGLRGRMLQERALEWVVSRATVTDVDATGVAGPPGNR
jgi:trigger factor